MIRLVQRKLILPRGDTGSFTIPVLPDFNAGDVAVFAIFNPLNKTIIFRKQVEIADNKITIQFSHNDTVNLPAGKYLWDIKAYLNPEYADGKLVNGDQIDSYYASYKLSECQIKETADDYLMADDAPTSTLSPNQLDLLSAILAELRDAVQKSQENVTHYPTIIDNYWYVWDANTGEYVDTDVKAGGVVVEGTGAGSARTIDFSYEIDGTQLNATQVASGIGAFAEGINTIASGRGAHAQGDTSEASGINAHAEGSGTKATNYDTHAEGYFTQATGPLSHAEGSTTIASGNDSHAEGNITVASGNHSHAEGDRTKASGNVSHAEGIFSTASGNYSHAENYQGEASGENSHAEGYISKATKNSAHAEGYKTEAKGNYSHSEGYETVVTGEAAHAEGHQASASKASAHAEGYHTQATNNNTHAQGYFTVASGLNSHAQGEFTNAVGKDSHAEGYYTYANGINSHSEGYATIVNGDYSHAGGYYTIASGNNQYVSGKYNIEDLNNLYAVIVGIGTYNNNRLNGYTLDWSGNGWYAGKVSVTDTTPVFDTDLTSKLYVDTMLALKADIQDIPDISGKADKVSNATNGNFASLDANGNLVDSGHKHSDYLTEHQDISGKQDVLTFDDSPQMISDNPVKSSGLWSAFNSVNSDITFINSQISYLQSQVIGKQDLLYFDTQPKVNSNHPVTSGGIKTAIDTAVSTKQDTLTFDNTPTANSTNPVTSGGVYEAITNIKTMGIHICTSQEYNSQTGIPIIVSPDTKTFYLVPGGEGSNLYIEWVYINNAWQQFGSATIDLSGYALLSDIPSNVSAFTNDAGYLTQHQDITGKQDVLTFDNVPTINSTNPVVSNGIYTAINNIIKIQETQPVDPNTKLWIHETNSQTVQVPTVSEVEDMISNAGYLTQHQDISGKADKSDTVLNTTLSRGRKANTTIGEGSFAFGMDTTASGAYSHAQGNNTSAARDYSHAEGSNTKAHGYYSHAEGHGSMSSNTCSHAQGSGTIASAICSHAEGQNTTASEASSHAEGTSTVASGAYSHAEGGSTIASGTVSHAEGGTTTASGDGSHAEGTYTVASGACSHAEGTNTIAAGAVQHVSGKYNIQDLNNKYAEIVGIGTYDNARANGRTLDWNGNAWYAGKVSVGNTTPTENNDLTSKAYVDSVIPTKLSDLTDDSGHYTKPASGIPASDLANNVIPDISNKIDKVNNAITGNFAALDANGNLTDSGSKASDFLTEHQDITGKADKVENATVGNFAALDVTGNIVDSGKGPDDITDRAPVIVNSASGAVAAFEDGANESVEALSVAVEPVQDLHGYDHPWPGGGGVNLLDISLATPSAASYGITKTIDSDGYVHLDGVCTTDNAMSLALIKAGASQIDQLTGKNYKITMTDVSGCTIRNTWGLRDGDNGQIAASVASPGEGVELHAKFRVVVATEAVTSYSPYSNICPISGWTGAKVWNDPKHGGLIKWNQLWHNPEDFGPQSNQTEVTLEDGVITAKLRTGTPSVYAPAITYRQSSVVLTAVANHKYLFACKFKPAVEGFPYLRQNTAFSVTAVFGTNRTQAGAWGNYANIVSATSAGGAAWYLGVGGDTTSIQPGDSFSIKDAMCFDLTEMFGAGNEPASVAEFKALFPAEYYPYNFGELTTVSAVNGNPYQHIDITFPTEAGTVYGGTLDVTNGTLTVDRTIVDLGTLTNSGDTGWKYITNDGTPYFRVYLTGKSPGLNMICSDYGTSQTTGTGSLADKKIGSSLNDVRIYLRDSTYTDLNTFISAMSGVQLVYELETPITYTLTPQEVTTLLGSNRIWADCGNIAVDYCADTKMYVDGAAPVQDVQVNGTSILSNGVANVPMASSSTIGAIKIGERLEINSSGEVNTKVASPALIKPGSNSATVIVPYYQHQSAFYGLAKAAGDTTQSQSDNAVGTYTNGAKVAIRTMLGVPSTAYATANTAGLVKVSGIGVQIWNDGVIGTKPATSSEIKTGNTTYPPITPIRQHESVFYGLAKAAGDTTQASSSNYVGYYTETAKSKIHEMLDAPVTVSGTDPVIAGKAGVRYICGECDTLTFTPPVSGIVDVVFTSGTTATVLSVPNTVKWPGWFDPTSLDASTTYEINIMDGVYGAVMAWT